MTAEIKTGEKMIVFMVNGKEYAISVTQVKSIENGKANEGTWRRTIYLRGNQFTRGGDSGY